MCDTPRQEAFSKSRSESQPTIVLLRGAAAHARGYGRLPSELRNPRGRNISFPSVITNRKALERRKNVPRSISAKTICLTLTLLVVLSAALKPRAVLAQDSSATPSPTATSSPTPESEELRRLRERNAILDEEKKAADSEKAIAEDKKAMLAAKFPSPSATPLEGKTEVDASVKIESQILTYKTMGDAADSIVREINDRGLDVKAVAVHNDKDVRALLSYMAVLRQLRLMGEEYDKMLAAERAETPESANPEFRTETFVGASEALTVAKSVLGGFIDLIALLRTDTSIKGVDVSIEEPALVSEVFRAMRLKKEDGGLGEGIKLYYPATFPPNFNANTPSEFLGAIQGLNSVKSRAEELITKIEENEKAYADTKAEVATLKKRQKQIPDEIAELDKEYEGLQKVHWKWPSSRLAERMEELTVRISKLGAERKKNAATLGEDAARLDELQKTIDDLYGHLYPTIPARQIAAALSKADEKVDAAQEILGRDFTAEEKKALLQGFEDDQQKALIKEAEKNAHRPLTEEEKAKLVQPLNDAERAALGTIAEKEEGEHKELSMEARIRLLSGGEQTALLGDVDKEILRKMKKVSLSRLKSLNAQYDKMVADLTKSDAASGTNPLTLYLQAENLREALACADTSDPDADPCPGSYLLQLKVVVAGGNIKTKKNLITNVFTGANISHSGGSIVEYNLFDMTGASKASNTLAVYEGYTSAKNIKQLSEGGAAKQAQDARAQKEKDDAARKKAKAGNASAAPPAKAGTN